MSAACAVALVLAACGSDDEDSDDSASGGGGDSGGSGGSTTLDIGLLTSLSGPAGSFTSTSVQGVQARFDAYEEDGGECADSVDFNLIQADDTSAAPGALAGAQRLVEQEDVYAMLEVSAFFYGASPYLTTQGQDVPVIGFAFDGAEQWLSTDNNLFSYLPAPDYTKVYSTSGDYLKSQGGTVVAGVAYQSPSSQAGLEQGLASVEAAGLEVGYTNDSVPFGSTDVGAIVLGIRDSGADALYLTINPDTAFAIVAGLRQAGIDLNVIVSPTGYGGDLLKSEPAVQIAQGVTFTTGTAPVEIGAPGAERLAQALEDAGADSPIPGFFQVTGWLAADTLIYGLEQAGCDASQAEFMSTLRGVDDYDGDGLLPTPRNFANATEDEQCSYYLKLDGNEFVPVEDASPLCGEAIN
ncbi:ABC transporter substrate-binding protein [Blastococcus sp. URHD0036]|uniref:ABC transporter substrate-binding protein n=1 Tax=Blastococcus sp. URHD0036 TaxID=1380356 RepID=UPI0018CC56F9|nr:ABC transporter substrate-binding protein [Blastococcus sp. URHD0036]